MTTLCVLEVSGFSTSTSYSVSRFELILQGKKKIIIVHSSVWPSALPAHHSAKQEINYVIFEAMSSDNDQDFI